MVNEQEVPYIHEHLEQGDKTHKYKTYLNVFYITCKHK